jgi:hypothetical protein
MRYALAILALLCVLVSSQNPTPPTWPNQWQATFNETMTYPVIGSSNTTGAYYYDWTNQQERVDRADGKWDRYCGSVYKLTSTPCSHIVVGGNRYLWFPQENYCCYCCNNTDGCGVLIPTWLSTATFQNVTEEEEWGNLDVWEINGLQSNYYYDIASNQIPYEINQTPNDVQYFNPATWQNSIADPNIFNLPSSQCNVGNTCSYFSVCTAAAGLY